jgi:hypothetical protein
LEVGGQAIPLPRVWLVILFVLLIKKNVIQQKIKNSVIGRFGSFCLRWKTKLTAHEHDRLSHLSPQKRAYVEQNHRNFAKYFKLGLVGYAAVEFLALYEDYKGIDRTPGDKGAHIYPDKSWWDDIMHPDAKYVKTGGGGGARAETNLVPYIVSFCFALSLPVFGTQKLKNHLSSIRSRFPFCKAFASKIQTKLETDPILNQISAADISTQKLFVSEAGTAVKNDILLQRSTGTQKHLTKTKTKTNKKKKHKTKHTGKH